MSDDIVQRSADYMAYKPSQAHCLFLQIKFYWNTATLIVMVSFALQWQSGIIVSETCP